MQIIFRFGAAKVMRIIKADNLQFLGLTGEDAAYESAKYAVLPVPFEQTTTFGRGTTHGPKSILEASQEVELYDEELRSEPFRAGVCTLEGIDVANVEGMIEKASDVISRVVYDRKIPVTLGGEHTVSIAPVKACAGRYKNLSVLQIDAHADLRAEYQGSKYSHACAMRRIRDYVKTTVAIGIRSLSREEADLADSDEIPLFFAKDIVGRDDWHDRVVGLLTDDVYVTIDLDGFDPSMIPGVGTPEPGGLGWYETLTFLRLLGSRRKVVGFDVVELMPIPGSLVSQFAAAKLIYKMIGYLEASAAI
jgi:agmatinase